MSESETSGTPSLSEEQVREYLEQLRDAPADQVIAEVVSVLLNAASAKLGRRDGRLLIDLAAALLERGREHISGDVAGQVDEALGQLRIGQVQAEAETGSDEPNDLTTTPAAPEGSQQPEPPGRPERREAPQTSKLWIPGRD